MKRLTTLISLAAALTTLPLQAQQYLIRLHRGGEVVHSAAAGDDARMTFLDGNATLAADGATWTSALADIDSLTFTTADATGDTVRIHWNGTTATVQNPYAAQGVSVTTAGACVTVVSTTTDEIPYLLSGSSSDGSLTLRAAKKITLRLESLDLTSASGPAIDISGGKKSTFTLTGASRLADATGGSHKAALQSKGDLVFRGTGSLDVTGNTRHAIRTKEDFALQGGTLRATATGTVNLVATGSGYAPDYCNAVKVAGTFTVSGGTLEATCPSGNAGGKAVSCDSTVSISGGILTLTATGTCARYQDSTGTYDSYASAGLKADGDIDISGGTLTITASGRAITTDGAYRQRGGSVTASTSADGFGTVPYSGSYFRDGFSPACLNADGDIVFTAGTFSGASTGKAGRGIRGKAALTVGTAGAADSLLSVSVTTSGAPFLAASSSTYWRGLPKGIKIEGDITVNSGHLLSYCSQTATGSGGGFGGKSPNGEAIETKASLYINGGDVEANALDDAINATSYIQINGGRVWAYARNNDGIDCNGSRIDITGGTVIAQGTEVAIDDNGDRGGRLYITGGIIVLVGGNMGTTEATPSVSNQKSLSIGSSGSPWGGGGSTSVSATNGICVKNSGGTEVLTFKAPTVSGNGFATTGGAKPPGPGGGSNGGKIFISSPAIQAGTYTYFTSPSISGGSHWHGLYSGATVATTGNGTSVTAQ
ncbi:MAG: carbohydrate-binding domain-containing protein [Bacteroidales bacterium]|nr:carbohydrate-binding domain-containing protein [Bacteroidales bacterium]